jgi:hypothetical protein
MHRDSVEQGGDPLYADILSRNDPASGDHAEINV